MEMPILDLLSLLQLRPELMGPAKRDAQEVHNNGIRDISSRTENITVVNIATPRKRGVSNMKKRKSSSNAVRDIA